jgi:tetratricopeptide (TPR) repeat protein
MPFDPIIVVNLLSVFGTVLQAATACDWITLKWKAANITNHDLQRALRASYEDALDSINFAFRQKIGLLDKLGKNRLHKEITASFNDQFLNPFITEKKLSTEEIKTLAFNCSSYCKLLSSSIDIVLPLTEVSEVTIEDLLLTGRNLKGSEDLSKLNTTAVAELIERIRQVEGIPDLFCELLAYKELLLGSIVFYFNERIKSDERVRSILMHSELQRIREEYNRQHHHQVALLEEALKARTVSFDICLTPIRDNLSEVRSSLKRVEAALEQNTKYLERIFDMLCQDRGLTDKERKQLQAGLSTTFNLHDKYDFDESSPIGYGSVAVVYKALHRGLKQLRALKVLKPEHRHNPEIVERFLREAIVLSSLNHPSIVKIYDAGGGGLNLDFYLEMEYAEGTSLRKYIETQPFNLDRALNLINQLGTAVQKMHEAGIIHRDLNPRNIMVDKSGNLKVMDFGVAKIVGVEGLTRDGQVVGTHDYMAPEQARGQRVDERADIYSIGVVIYELCTKRMPSTPLNPMRQYQVGVPQWLEDIVAKCLAQDRNNRYSSAADILLAFDVGNTGTLPIATKPEEDTQPTVPRAIPDRVTGETVVSSGAAAQVARPVNVVEAESTDLIDSISKPITTKTSVNIKAWVWVPIIIVVLIACTLGIMNHDKVSTFFMSPTTTPTSEELASDNRSIELNPEDAQAYHDRGFAFNAQGEWDKAIAEFNKAIELDPRFVEAYNNRGLSYINKGDNNKAIADYSKAIQLNQNIPVFYTNRGNAYYDNMEYDKAIVDYTTAIELYPKQSGAYHNRGNAYYMKMEYDKAIDDYTKAIELDPKHAEAYTNRGSVYDSMKEYDKAIADYTKAIELDPSYADPYNNRGLVYHEKQEYDKAIADYTMSIELNPKYAIAYGNRGNDYANKGDYDKAIADYTKAIELDPEDLIAYNQRGMVYTRKGDYDKAIDDYTKAIEIDPTNVKPYNNRGNAYEGKKEYDKAIVDYTTAIEITPKYSLAYCNRGNAYARKGNYDKAVDDYTTAIEITPTYAAAYFYRGHVYRLKGDQDRAVADFGKAYDLGWR